MAAFGRLPDEKPEISHLGFQQKLLPFLACFCWFLKDPILCWKFLFGMRKMKHDVCHDMFMSMYMSIL